MDIFKHIQTKMSSCNEWLVLPGEYIHFLNRMVRLFFTHGVKITSVFDAIILQIYTSLPLVIVSGMFLGSIFTLQAHMILTDKGLNNLTGIILLEALFYELGPLILSFILVAKSGVPMCLKLGHMYLSEQLDMLMSMGISPILFLIVPMILGDMILMPCLCLVHAVIGLFVGGVIASHFIGINKADMMLHIQINASIQNIVIGVIFKSIIFAFIISSMGAFYGVKPVKNIRMVHTNASKFALCAFSLVMLANFVIDLSVVLQNKYY